MHLVSQTEKRVALQRRDEPSRGATISEIGYENELLVRAFLVLVWSRLVLVRPRSAVLQRGFGARADSGEAGGGCRKEILASYAAARPLHRARRRGGIPSGHPRAGAALWILALAVSHHQGAGDARAARRNRPRVGCGRGAD